MENVFLLNNYYSIKSIEKDGEEGIFTVEIMPGSEIFLGHFPGNAICPGVCNIEIIRECACMLTNVDLVISSIKQCRFTNVARPDDCGLLAVHIKATANDNAFTVTASISGQDKEYVSFKGTMK